MSDTAKLLLPNGQTTIIDAEDLERVVALSPWYDHKKQGYILKNIYFPPNQRKTLILHRFLVNAPKGMVVDHINGNKLDNRKANLRIVTHAQNQRNRAGAQRNSKSGVRGVHMTKGYWCPVITHHRKKIHLGTFKNFDEAVAARREAEKRLWPDPNDHASSRSPQRNEGEK